jgi:hypothetical protein
MVRVNYRPWDRGSKSSECFSRLRKWEEDGGGFLATQNLGEPAFGFLGISEQKYKIALPFWGYDSHTGTGWSLSECFVHFRHRRGHIMSAYSLPIDPSSKVTAAPKSTARSPESQATRVHRRRRPSLAGRKAELYQRLGNEDVKVVAQDLLAQAKAGDLLAIQLLLLYTIGEPGAGVFDTDEPEAEPVPSNVTTVDNRASDSPPSPNGRLPVAQVVRLPIEPATEVSRLPLRRRSFSLIKPLPAVTKRAILPPTPAPPSTTIPAPEPTHRPQTVFYHPRVPPRVLRQGLEPRLQPAEAGTPTPSVMLGQGRAFNARAPSANGPSARPREIGCIEINDGRFACHVPGGEKPWRG